MKTLKFYLTACLLILALGSAAQKSVDERVKEIRAAYAARLGMMENQPYDDIKVERMTISYNRMYPGTGMFQYDDTYYWTDDENEDYMLLPQLYFVTSKYTMNSGIYRYYREYLFDMETGDPMFLLITTQLGDDKATLKEYRFYFDEGKLIKQVPERIGPFDDDELIKPDFAIDEKGRAVGLEESFKGVAETFNSIIPTYAW